MGARILIVQGHPDVGRVHMCRTLAHAYAEGAKAAGHDVELVEPARLVFPLLSSAAEWRHGTPPPRLVAAQESIRRANHLVLLYPLWLGDMPAVLKGFLEQVVRPGFAIAAPNGRLFGDGLLRGRSARLVVSTPMAAPLYRWVHGAHSIKLMRRSILGPAGIAPMRTTVVGGAGRMNEAEIERWRERLRGLGRAHPEPPPAPGRRFQRSTSTGTVLWPSTFQVSLPISRPARPPRPRDAITIRSHCCSRAVRTMAS